MAPLKVAVYIYPSADVLDFSGPVEIYSMAPESETPDFIVTSFAHHNPVSAGTGALTYTPNASFGAVSADLAQYDILVVPGAWPATIDKLVQTAEGKEMCELIQRFVTLPPRPEAGARVLQSVCTGSLILAAAGVLAGRRATTHHQAQEELVRFADRAAGGEKKSGIEIVNERWVDVGMTEAGVRIVNAAGVSSGIDTSLWIMEQLVGKEKADWAAEVAEFERREHAWKA
jgi:transcriptional regulator GlxA family with amidase domain